jgi:hypothetical protein
VNGTHRASPQAEAPAGHTGLAKWLLDRETTAGTGSLGLADATEQVCQKLTSRLARLVSAGGSQALLSRALHVAQPQFPFLMGVRAGLAPGAALERLSEQLAGVDPEQALDGLVAVLDQLFDLLGKFIGDDLTLRLVREVWPDLPAFEPSQGTLR